MFKEYRKKGITLMRPYVPGEDLAGVSVSAEDIPKDGDMIAINPKKPNGHVACRKTVF